MSNFNISSLSAANLAKSISVSYGKPSKAGRRACSLPLSGRISEIQKSDADFFKKDFKDADDFKKSVERRACDEIEMAAEQEIIDIEDELGL